MSYQPGWKDGQEIGTGQRDAAGRYEAIRRELFPHREFSVLDLGAYSGYFSYRLAEEFDARCVAVDKIKTLQPRPGVEVWRQFLSARDLQAIEYAEFEVTLLLSVLHHMPDWHEALAAVVGFSEVTFVELPDPREVLPNAISHADTPKMHAMIKVIGGIIIAWTPGYDDRYTRPLYVIGRLT